MVVGYNRGLWESKGWRFGERGAKSRRDAGVTELQPQRDRSAEPGMTTQDGKKSLESKNRGAFP
jgi:hypothetical protein